jgi:hypothetical protein
MEFFYGLVDGVVSGILLSMTFVIGCLLQMVKLMALIVDSILLSTAFVADRIH